MRRMNEMDEELDNLDKASASVDEKLSAVQGGGAAGAQAALDDCSIYIGQVDYEATAEELRLHFSSCGIINRVTIMVGPTGHAKGYGYIEFGDKEAVDKALLLDDTPFKGRQLKVLPKRQNQSAASRGQAMGGRGGGRGGYVDARGGGRGGRFAGRGGRFGGRGGGRSYGGRGGGRFSGRGRGGRGRWNESSSYY